MINSIYTRRTSSFQETIFPHIQFVKFLCFPNWNLTFEFFILQSLCWDIFFLNTQFRTYFIQDFNKLDTSSLSPRYQITERFIKRQENSFNIEGLGDQISLFSFLLFFITEIFFLLVNFKGNWVDFHFFKKLGVCIRVCACGSVYINQDFIFLISLRGKTLKYHYL